MFTTIKGNPKEVHVFVFLEYEMGIGVVVFVFLEY